MLVKYCNLNINGLDCAFKAVKTLVPLWQRGKSLQAAINAEASCFNDNDHDMVLFSDLLSLFKSHRFIHSYYTHTYVLHP